MDFPDQQPVLLLHDCLESRVFVKLGKILNILLSQESTSSEKTHRAKSHRSVGLIVTFPATGISAIRFGVGLHWRCIILVARLWLVARERLMKKGLI